MAALGVYDLLGGVHTSPSVAVAASSWDQASLVFDAMRVMVKESPTLAPLAEVYDSEIEIKGGPGKAFRVAAVAGTNEGHRLTTLVCDELHEWVGAKERVYTVLANACAKRAPGSCWTSRAQCSWTWPPGSRAHAQLPRG